MKFKTPERPKMVWSKDKIKFKCMHIYFDFSLAVSLFHKYKTQMTKWIFFWKNKMCVILQANTVITFFIVFSNYYVSSISSAGAFTDSFPQVHFQMQSNTHHRKNSSDSLFAQSQATLKTSS